MDADGVRRLGRHFADEVQRELPVGLLPAGDSPSYLRPSAVDWLWRSTFPPRLTSVSPVLPMNRLVTCNLSLVTGDLRMLFPIVTLFSISSYQLPVTSYQLQVSMVHGPNSPRASNRHDLRFFVRQMRVDLGDVLIGQLLRLLLSMRQIVLGNLAFLGFLLE